MAKEKLTLETGKITKVTKGTVIDTGERFLDVTIQIGSGKTKEIMKQGFPLDTTDKEIKASLKKLLQTRASDKEVSKKSEETQVLETAGDKTIEKLEGVTIE